MEKGKVVAFSERTNIPNKLYQELYEGVQEIKQDNIVDWDDVYKDAKEIEKCTQSKQQKDLGYDF